jgi:hypothetical protein
MLHVCRSRIRDFFLRKQKRELVQCCETKSQYKSCEAVGTWKEVIERTLVVACSRRIQHPPRQLSLFFVSLIHEAGSNLIIVLGACP